MTVPAAAPGTDHLADLDLKPNEASGLLRVADRTMLDRHGWDRAFWTVLDEVDAPECIAVIGHRERPDLASGWDCWRLPTIGHGDAGPADDAEAVARHGPWVYVFGSQHGGKRGPVRRREQWVARFREADAAGGGPVSLEVVPTRFLLHRLINDALLGGGLDVVAMRRSTRAAFIDATVDELAGTPDAGRVTPHDWTINVEGAEFTPGGSLLLGLRFPVTTEGWPIVVALAGCDRLFDGGTPEVTGLWAIDAVGRGGTLAGIRDLCLVDDTLHVVTGNLDSKGKGSVILDDYPAGRDTVNTHFAVDLPSDLDQDLHQAVFRLTAREVRQFPDHPRIEGIAADGLGRFFYVSDEDAAVHLRSTPLLAGR